MNIFLGVIFIFIGIPLILISFASTTYMNQYWNEQTFLIRNDYIQLGIISAFFTIVCYFIFLFKGEKINSFLDRNHKYILSCILIIQECIGVFIIVNLKLAPRGDQEMMLQIVSEFINGDYNSVQPGQYISSNHQQFGWFWYCYLITKVFGDKRDIIIQLINLQALMVFDFFLAKITYQLWNKRDIQILTCVMCIIFFPLTFYVTYEYGNILGLSCSIVAISQLISFMQSGRMRYAICYIFNIVLAGLLKNNYLIFLIGTVLVFTVYCIVNYTEWKKIGIVVMTIAVYLIISYFCKAALEIKSKIDIIDGIPSICYVDMGLHENEQHAGWYDSQYTWGIYCTAHFDKSEITEMAKSDIQKQVEHWKNNPKEAINFFVRKNASQWNQPTFQGWWILQNRTSNKNYSLNIQKFMSIKCGKKLEDYLNVFHFLVLSFSVLCIVMKWREMTVYEWILPIIFIGGYIFHTVWEAKGQYTVSYFVLLIPYAVAGMKLFFARIEVIKHMSQSFSIKRYLTIGLMLGFLVCFAIIFYTETWTTLTNDKENFERYYQTESIKGKYLLNDKTAITIDQYYNDNTIILDNEQYLAVNENQTIVLLKNPENPDFIRWKIVKKENDERYYITYGGDMYLTLNGFDGYKLEKYNGKSNQEWSLQQKGKK